MSAIAMVILVIKRGAFHSVNTFTLPQMQPEELTYIRLRKLHRQLRRGVLQPL